jgi:hypothetical protein
MELTVMNKKRYDELMSSVKNLETQVALAHSQLRAIQDSNNQLAEIAFDEARFTDVVLNKVDELAREAARDTIDIDDIASEVANNLDVSEEVQRAVERLDVVSRDDVNDLISDYINNEDLVNESQVEQMICDYVDQNCDYVEKDVTDELHDDIQELKENMKDMIHDAVEDVFHRLIGESLAGHTETITLNVLQLIANKLTGKDTHHANNNRDHGLYISGTLTQGETASDGEARA